MKTLWLMFAALTACGANEAATVPTTVTSAGITVQRDHAIEQITDDRCNRQLSCGNVGKGMTYRDRTDCERKVSERASSVLGQGQQCAIIDAARLTACIHDIRDQRCADTGEVPPSCMSEQLCR
jgi:hypothetical protein